MAVPESINARGGPQRSRAAISEGSMAEERRRYMRYRVRDNVFAALTEPAVVVGKIKDLSMGGAAFEFVADSFERVEQGSRQTVDLFVLGSTEGLASMPCIVTIRETPREHRDGYAAPSTWTCVAEFKDLPMARARDLLDFLMRHSVGYAA